MKSMTGFGRGESVSRGLRYAVEIGTVNRRSAELIFNLPRELSPLENKMRELISPTISRGRATITAAVSGGDRARPLLDAALFQRLHDELRQVQRSLRLPDGPTLADLTRLYPVAARETGAASPDATALTRATRAAVRALDLMRAKEGAHLARELGRLLGRLGREIAAIGKLAPGITARHRQQMRTRLASLEPSFAADDERLARELALFADRSDITEELSRLTSHIDQFRAGLATKDAAGRSLDFLAQEMFRECNTIGAKANSAAVTRHVINAKTELERLREQVQNVE
jgi:uncharacterized protein (TIGR00255 family)